MKIIHTADIHLDSPLAGVANPETRRYELLTALSDLAQYANNCGVGAIIVAGDLFDSKFATSATIQSVAEIMRTTKAQWYVLQGNHGDNTPYAKLKELFADVLFFDTTWTTYFLADVAICGIELTPNVNPWQSLQLDCSKYNVLMLHGDVDDPTYGLIDGKAIAASGAKYVALGHRHAFCQHQFGRVKGCYSGVLECRGFDEPAQTGFVVVDTVQDTVQFVPQARRRIVPVTVDVTNLTSNVALQNAIADAVSGVAVGNYLNVTFVGQLADGINVDFVAHQFLDGKYFALRIKDSTTIQQDVAAIASEISLRGEFAKLALTIADDQLRQEVLKLGLAYLNGEVEK